MYNPYIKLEKSIDHYVGKLIVEKQLIKEGDSVLVGLSGGKDSWTLAYFLKKFQAKAPINFELGVATLDVMFDKKQKAKLKKGVADLGLDYFVIDNNIEEVIAEKRTEGTSYCSFCARLRRAYLYRAAQDLGYNKIALGHHFDDFIETYIMNIFYHGRTKGMPAILKAQNGVNELIRPLLYCPEKAIIRFAKYKKFPIVHCNCRDSVKTDKHRKYVKNLLNKLDKHTPGMKRSIQTAAQNVIIDHIF